jgi:hypothetical protein
MNVLPALDECHPAGRPKSGDEPADVVAACPAGVFPCRFAAAAHQVTVA